MDALSQNTAYQVLGKSGLAAGTTTTVSTGGSITYAIRGKTAVKGQVTNGTTPTTDFATGAAFVAVTTSKGSVFTIGFNAAGTMKAVQGSIESLDASGAFIRAPQFGPIPDDYCPFGYLVIKAGSTASAAGWVFGTNNMSSVTGITYAFVDTSILPDRPQVS